MPHILVIWTLIGLPCRDCYAKYDWRPIGEFSSSTACANAAANLGIINPTQFRCLKKGD